MKTTPQWPVDITYPRQPRPDRITLMRLDLSITDHVALVAALDALDVAGLSALSMEDLDGVSHVVPVAQLRAVVLGAKMIDGGPKKLEKP